MVSTVGSRLPAALYSTVQARASSASGITRSAAKYSSTVPNSAWAMPTPQRMKYFHAASTASGVRYRDTSSTVARVAPSMATHRMPMLLVVSAAIMVNMKP